jgi:TonB family protein
MMKNLVLLACAVLLPACASGSGGAPEAPAAPASARGGPADTIRVYDIEEVTVKPRLVNTGVIRRSLEENYSGVLRDAGERGTVTIRMVVERTGETSFVTVVGSTNLAFNLPATNVVRAMRFQPALVNGVPVRVRIELPVTFEPAS